MDRYVDKKTKKHFFRIPQGENFFAFFMSLFPFRIECVVYKAFACRVRAENNIWRIFIRVICE